MGAVAVILLIVCANIGHLQLVRANRQQHQVALQTALGATRANLALRAMLQATLLAVGGAVAGILLAVPLLWLLLALAPPNLPRLNEIHLNAHVFAFCPSSPTPPPATSAASSPASSSSTPAPGSSPQPSSSSSRSPPPSSQPAEPPPPAPWKPSAANKQNRLCPILSQSHRERVGYRAKRDRLQPPRHRCQKGPGSRSRSRLLGGQSKENRRGFHPIKTGKTGTRKHHVPVHIHHTFAHDLTTKKPHFHAMKVVSNFSLRLSKASSINRSISFL